MQSTDWSYIRSEQPHSGACECCGLPYWSRATVCKLPNQRGWFCSISCLECTVFGPGRCRWCRAFLEGKSDRRYCDDSCRRRASEAPFADGTRLLRFVSVHHPALYRLLVGNEGEQRGGSLADKRSGAKFCSARCRVAANRQRLDGDPKAEVSATRPRHVNTLQGSVSRHEHSIKETR